MAVAGWTQTAGHLQRTAQFGSFKDAVLFVQHVAQIAEALQHHPSLCIKGPDVSLELTTHEANNTVTSLDEQLATSINAVLETTAKFMAWQPCEAGYRATFDLREASRAHLFIQQLDVTQLASVAWQGSQVSVVTKELANTDGITQQADIWSSIHTADPTNYDPHRPTDAQLVDDLRIVSAWFVNQRTDPDFKYSEDQVAALHCRIMQEMTMRGLTPFLPAQVTGQEMYIQSLRKMPEEHLVQLDALLHQHYGLKESKQRFHDTHQQVSDVLHQRKIKDARLHPLPSIVKSADAQLDLVATHQRVHRFVAEHPESVNLLESVHDDLATQMHEHQMQHSIEDVLDIWLLEKASRRTTVQTLIFDRAKFKSSESAVKWAKTHRFSADKVDETDSSFRLRQRDPDDFQKGSFRTISLTDGVQAVVGRLKG